jgi:hypothetical protein
MGYIGPSLDPPLVRRAMDPTDVGLIPSSVRSTLVYAVAVGLCLANQMGLFLRMIARQPTDVLSYHEAYRRWNS